MAVDAAADRLNSIDRVVELELESVAPRLVLAPPSPPAYVTRQIPDGLSAGWNAVSLFAGGGGLDLGFLMEGIRTESAYDDSRKAIRSHCANLPSSGFVADLARYTPEGRCDLLLAGAPCQGFSTVGRRAVSDPRNALLMRVGDVALKTRPRVVVVENVPAALSGAHRQIWENLEDRLRINGYNVRRLVLTGEDSGLAQRRKRLFLLAWIGSDCVRMDIAAVRSPGLTSVLADVEFAEGHIVQPLADTDPMAIVARAIPPGAKLCNVRQSSRAVPTWSIPRVFGATSSEERTLLVAVSILRRRKRIRKYGDGDPVSPEALRQELGRDPEPDVQRLVEAGYLREIDGRYELRHTYNGRYRRLCWQEASPTVDTHFGRPDLFLHPDENRGMSVREAARIQGFPDAYQLPSSTKDGYQIIGNAVPPPMAARLASFIREALLKRA